MEGKRKKSMRGLLLIFLGLLMIGGACGLTAYNVWDSNRAGEAAGEALETLETEMEDYQEELAEWKQENDILDGDIPESITHALLGGDENLAMPGMEVDGNVYIGVVTIPALDVEHPVMGDWKMEWLKTAPCRYSGSYYQDNMVVMAHNYQSHFGPIQAAAPGMDVYFKNVEGLVYHYIVTNVEILQPTAVDAMITAADWDLTLFTCTPGGGARCAVRCARVEDSGF